MLKQILDLHIHSKYSRACSGDLELPKIAKACEIKGIDIVATGDFTHPAWFAHIKENLYEYSSGIYKLKNNSSKTKFIIGTELSAIKKHKDKVRRVHLCVFAPNIETAEKFINKLDRLNINLKSDGRPIIGLTAKDILSLMLETDEKMFMVPAHAWTPWFGIFGSKSGYDSLEETFEELTPHIKAIETGLSSDPEMNWRCNWLDNITLISNSDAHSLAKIGREANVMSFENEKTISYAEIMKIIKNKDNKKFLHTIEFFPEEGKYHYDGHRDCNFSCDPNETKKYRGLCPKCKKELVIGVLNRVYELADKNYQYKKNNDKIPFYSAVPLEEILADLYNVGINSKKIKAEYDNLIKNIGPELYILIDADIKLIKNKSSEKIANAINKVRNKKLYITPGYDGEFGKIKIFKNDDERGIAKQLSIDM
jgi:uncharacterized protein (TIGR00375 family)